MLNVDAFKILPDFKIFIQFHWNLCCYCIHFSSPTKVSGIKFNFKFTLDFMVYFCVAN